MAIDVDNLDIILRLIGLRSFQAGMAEARASVAAVGKQAIASDEAMAASSTKAMSRMAMLRKVSLGVAGAIVVTAAAGYKMSVDYQRQIEMIHADAGATQKEAMFMYRSILTMTSSGKFAQGPVEMAKAAYHLESVGLRGRTAMRALAASSNLAAIGNAHLEDTTSALGAAWRAYKGEGISFNNIVATLNATAGAGNMRMNDLVAALGTGVLPVAKTAGLNIKDVGGALALLTDEGQHADNAATHLRMAINLLAAPSKLARKELKGIGLDALSLSDQMKTPRGLIVALETLRARLYTKFPGRPVPLQDVKGLMANDPSTFAHLTHAQSQRMNVLSRAFGGARSGATIMAFVDQLEALRQKTNQVYRTSTDRRFSDNVAKTQETSAFKLRAAWSQAQTQLLLVGNVIRGPVTAALVLLLHGFTAIVSALRWFIGAGVGVVRFWKSLPQPIHMVGQAIVTFVGILALYRAAQMAAIALTIAWAAVTGALTDAIEIARIAMYVFVMDNPILLAITAIIVIIILAITHWKQFKKWGVEAWNAIKHAASAAWGWIKNAVHNIWDGIQWLWHKLTHLKLPGWVHTIMHVLGFTPMGMVIKGVSSLIPGHAEGIMGAPGGFAMINERASGETVYLPRGSSVQPSAAASYAVPRAHVPNPAPSGAGGPIVLENHVHAYIGRKEVYKAVTRTLADEKARKGGN